MRKDKIDRQKAEAIDINQEVEGGEIKRLTETGKQIEKRRKSNRLTSMQIQSTNRQRDMDRERLTERQAD